MRDYYDYVYIEDDYIFRIHWESEAKKKKILILTLKSVDDFYNHSDKISKEDTRIFIDSHLGDDVPPGEEFAVKLHNEGFKHISMASSRPKSHFKHIPWIKNIGKMPPFIR